MLQKQRHRESRQSENDGGPLHGHEEESQVPQRARVSGRGKMGVRVRERAGRRRGDETVLCSE